MLVYSPLMSGGVGKQEGKGKEVSSYRQERQQGQTGTVIDEGAIV